MESNHVEALQARRALIRARWEALLRQQRANGPLAHADTLVHLIGWALGEIFAALEQKERPGVVAPIPPEIISAGCDCGQNPLLAFFLCGEQALLEALVQSQARIHRNETQSHEAAVAELYLVVRHLAGREMDAFCAVCQGRPRNRRATVAPLEFEPVTLGATGE